MEGDVSWFCRRDTWCETVCKQGANCKTRCGGHDAARETADTAQKDADTAQKDATAARTTADTVNAQAGSNPKGNTKVKVATATAKVAAAEESWKQANAGSAAAQERICTTTDSSEITECKGHGSRCDDCQDEKECKKDIKCWLTVCEDCMNCPISCKECRKSKNRAPCLQCSDYMPPCLNCQALIDNLGFKKYNMFLVPTLGVPVDSKQSRLPSQRVLPKNDYLE